MAGTGTPRVLFTENKGQWPTQVLYRALIPGGALFVERTAFTYVVTTGMGHHHHAPGEEHHPDGPKGHAWRVHFEDGEAQGHGASLPQPHYENYYLGNDTSRWAGHCGMFGEVLLQDVWPGIDIRLDGREGLKYDVIISPGADPALARLVYEGVDGLILMEGDLQVHTSIGMVVEKAPVAWSQVPSGRVDVSSAYRSIGDTLLFDLCSEYDPAWPLVIDPELSFSSYIGSSANNFGFTATYDGDGHLYGGGIVFQTGYPTTLGPFDPSFNGGTIDVGLTKFSPDGSALIWSTYYGGLGNEAPHSMVVNAANELYVMGTTSSSDLPVTAGCFDPNYSSNTSIDLGGLYGFDYASGCDIFVARFNEAGTALIGSTYVGGTGADGINIASALYYNYGDPFRGEITLDLAGNPIVATTTTSTNMPVTPGAPQPAHGGGTTDAFFFRMDPGLTTMLWATYFGGSGNDSGYGLQVSSTGDVYCTGGTTSPALSLNGAQNSFSGAVDGYITRYSPGGNTLLSGTFLGTPQYDQAYFVQLDVDDNVYVVGQTRGAYPITPGKYNVPGSSQFIHKFSTDLTTSMWSTRIGSGNGAEDISPSAFLVSDCRQIYFSGWGGSTNNHATPNSSSTFGLPTTSDAYQSTTDGNDFYLMVLEPEAEGLNYASFFGGNVAPEHVDGGTSRFDKDGKVYQAVCAGCQGQSDFPTTPGAWSNTNGSTGCNLAVMKFDLSTVVAIISIDGPDVVCAPAVVGFQSQSSGGDTYHWDLGDGSTSTEESPSHTYTSAGVYTVTLTVTDSHDCVIGATTTMQVTVMDDVVASIEPVEPICPGGEVQLVAMPPGNEYAWSPAIGLSATNVQSPTASPGTATTYQVVVSGLCGMDTAEVEVTYAEPELSMLPDVSICIGESTMLGASGGISYAWSPSETLDDPTSASPVATPAETTIYTVTVITSDGCEITGTVRVEVVPAVPAPVLEDLLICAGSSVQLHAPFADWYVWHPAPGLQETNIQSPTVSPSEPTTYIVECGNACGSMMDTVFVDLIEVQALAWPDTVICPGTSIRLHASGGATYSWQPPLQLDDATSQDPLCTPYEAMEYTVTVTDDHGCDAEAGLEVRVHPWPFVDAGPDIIADYGREVQLFATGAGSFQWSPYSLAWPADAPDPVTKPEESTLYTVVLVDENGCRATDEVWVILNGSFFVPNAFTPNGDGLNDLFGAWGKEIAEIEMYVFDRWGMQVFQSNDLDHRWDGRLDGRECPPDIYVWRVDLVERNGAARTVHGHVTLVR